MPSAITHFIVGASLALPAVQSRAIRKVLSPAAVVLSSGFLAAAPDLDTFFLRAFDIPRGSLFAHRAFFHTPFFLMLVSVALAFAVARRVPKAILPLALVWAGCAITHPLLDMLTDGGSGVMLLFPFSETRLFFPWQPIRVSPLGVARFFQNGRAVRVLTSEAPFDAAALFIGCVVFWLRKSGRSRSAPRPEH
jgi:inner membrane protein